ncbi:MAG TPA: rhomboid family intramembrane serine protease, partial [Mariprofundaceae bacterium]|nr:rhomboid family intramembrane serine protease [Mariprofundaceae bacterium]
MLIVPFAKKMNWKKPPVVTIALVLVNVLVFSFWQAGDGKRYEAAMHQYLHSSLPKIEFPRYEEFLRQHQQNDDADTLAEMRTDPHAYPAIVQHLQHDAPFLRAMANGEVVKKGEPDFERWREDRRDFEEKFDKIVSEAHTFKPAFPEISDAFTHMFMHGGVMHLVGNMVFLLIVGLVVERLLGSGLYLIAYLTGGLIALAFFTAGNSDSAVPLLGASGAIAGMMGMYAAFFGKRRIPFFYSLGFYFDTVRAPAWVLLIAWMGNEAYQLLTDDTSNVAYLAHFGGLLGGGLMGYLATHFQLVDAEELE